VTGQATQARQDVLLAYRHVQRAIRDARWKLSRYLQVNVTQLFDLRTDPQERTTWPPIRARPAEWLK
jgi:arylsulfatase A-like enzyme